MLLTLINDILDLSKIKSGKMEIINDSYETGELFSEIVNMIWIKAKEKGLEFRLHVDSSIPSMLCGDAVRIKQILINLLNNAIKYTTEGSISLSVRCERLGLNRVRVWYSVEDTGQGVKKENIPYIFNAFRRVDEEKPTHRRDRAGAQHCTAAGRADGRRDQCQQRLYQGFQVRCHAGAGYHR